MGLDFVRVMFINVFLMIVGRDVSTICLLYTSDAADE